MRKYVKMLVLLVCLAAVCITAASAEEYDAYYYVSSSEGEHHNDGMSPKTPLKTFTDVSKVAAASEGECVAIVFMDAYTLASGVNKPIAHDNTFVYTTYDGVTDYAKENGAKLVFGKSCVFQIAGPTKWENISFEYKSSLTFVANYHAMAFGENIGMQKLTAEGNGIYVYGGYRAPNDSVTEIELDTHLSFASGTVVIHGGDWQRLRLGNSGDNPTNVTTSVVMNGGTIHEYVIMVTTSHRSHVGSGSFVLNGGTVKGNVYGAYYSTASTIFKGDLSVVLGGGTVHGGVYATKNGTGVLSGSFTVTVKGGDLSQIPEIVGTNTETFRSKLISETALPSTVKVSGF